MKVPDILQDKSNPLGYIFQSVQEFTLDSIRLVRRCTKPDAREFRSVAYACTVGFFLMGFIGYTVKLVFIPINNIIMGGQNI
ncbi:Sec61-gamma subunit of translocation complex [Cryptosporidium xiaoi]|uniref:Sec61-gamma subunit of translocation complex n=1 Tax=Cryptosporidium xiaoi TaxID=659607 RepID=A0AAV9XXJ4_9CRYT|nr:Sec61-gamma subunit of translocation complex [Cryptosporidium bovis]